LQKKWEVKQGNGNQETWKRMEKNLSLVRLKVFPALSGEF